MPEISRFFGIVITKARKTENTKKGEGDGSTAKRGSRPG